MSEPVVRNGRVYDSLSGEDITWAFESYGALVVLSCDEPGCTGIFKPFHNAGAGVHICNENTRHRGIQVRDCRP